MEAAWHAPYASLHRIQIDVNHFLAKFYLRSSAFICGCFASEVNSQLSTPESAWAGTPEAVVQGESSALGLRLETRARCSLETADGCESLLLSDGDATIPS